MNFFLDSTVFQNGKDVFMNNKLSKEFLNICKQHNFPIYISTVVLDETRRQYSTFMNDQLNKIKDGHRAVNQVPQIHVPIVPLPSIQDILNSYDSYFKSLEVEGVINIVPYCNDFLPDLVHRSIHRIKPFTESKQEFRDAIVWFSYAKLAEERQLEKCYLITGNTSDYSNKEGKIHKELEERSNRFILFRDMHAVLNASFMEPYKATNELLESLRKQPWNIALFMEFLELESTKNYITEYLMDDSDDKLSNELWIDVNLFHRIVSDINVFNLAEVEIRGVNIISSEFIVSGTVIAEIQVMTTAAEDALEAIYPETYESKLKVFFDVVYDTASATYKNLEISDYYNEEAREFEEGRHRVKQDKY